MILSEPVILGIPIDFVVFGLTLLCVAVFHHHTLRVALLGLAAITTYKIFFTGFKTGAGMAGFISHIGHEWVILVNLLCLLMGFALLARHFEKSHLPVVLPRFLPHDWKGRFMLLVIVWCYPVSSTTSRRLWSAAQCRIKFSVQGFISAIWRRLSVLPMRAAHGASWAIRSQQ